jgi:hypothetical protein
MAYSYLITEGSVFQFKNKLYILKERSLTQCTLQNGDTGEVETFTKDECPAVFERLVLG